MFGSKIQAMKRIRDETDKTYGASASPNVMSRASHWMTIFGAAVWLTVFYALFFGGMVSTRGGM